MCNYGAINRRETKNLRDILSKYGNKKSWTHKKKKGTMNNAKGNQGKGGVVISKGNKHKKSIPETKELIGNLMHS